MSEITEDILNGIMCKECGVWMDDMFDKNGDPNDKWENPPGYPRLCDECKNILE